MLFYVLSFNPIKTYMYLSSLCLRCSACKSQWTFAPFSKNHYWMQYLYNLNHWSLKSHPFRKDSPYLNNIWQCHFNNATVQYPWHTMPWECKIQAEMTLRRRLISWYLLRKHSLNFTASYSVSLMWAIEKNLQC